MGGSWAPVTESRKAFTEMGSDRGHTFCEKPWIVNPRMVVTTNHSIDRTFA